MLTFGDLMEDVELNDLGFRSSPFTWNRVGVFERLDKVIGNNAWVVSFLNCLVTHLPRFKSDYRPLLLSLRPSLYSQKGCPFFLAGWVEHLGFYNFVNEKWSMANSLSHFTNQIRSCNKNVYGQFGHHKKG